MKKFLVILSILFVGVVQASDQIKLKLPTVQELPDKTVKIRLTKSNILIFNDYFNRKSTTELMDKARKMDADLPSGDPLFLFLYTGGGYIHYGMEMINLLSNLKRPVHTITYFAASMGFQTVQYLGTRYILRFGELMSHKARGGFYGEFGDGNSTLDSRYVHWMRKILAMDVNTVKRTKNKQTLQSYRKAYESELWLTEADAIKNGYADAIAVPECDVTLKEGTWTRSFRYRLENAWVLTFVDTYSDCPLIFSPLKMQMFLSDPYENFTIEWKGEAKLLKEIKDQISKQNELNENIVDKKLNHKKSEDNSYSFSSSIVLPDQPNQKFNDLNQYELKYMLKEIKAKQKKHNSEIMNKKKNIKYSY